MKIVIAGEGGQGVQSIANIMTEAAYDQGRQALYIPNFGVEQRGGVSVAFIQVADEEISSLKFQKADIVMALSPRAVARTAQYVNEKTLFIYEAGIGESEVEDAGITATGCRILPIDAMHIVRERLNTRVFNVLIMGAAIAASDLVRFDYAVAALENKLGDKFKKNPVLREMNLEALSVGAELITARGGEK